MSRVKRWRDCREDLSVELLLEDGWLHLGKKIPEALLQNIPEGSIAMELIMEVSSSGYSDPGYTSGLPENCYPPEYEDERTIADAKYQFYGDNGIPLGAEIPVPTELYRSLEDLFKEEIKDLEIDYD